MSQSRKHRGYKTQDLVARYLASHGFPYAMSAGAGREGSDITGTPGIDWEVKARAKFDPMGTMKQQANRVSDELPIAVMRLNGQGENSVGSFCVIMRFDELVLLLRKAGYGE